MPFRFLLDWNLSENYVESTSKTKMHEGGGGIKAGGGNTTTAVGISMFSSHYTTTHHDVHHALLNFTPVHTRI
jgi:hypothetical protein